MMKRIVPVLALFGLVLAICSMARAAPSPAAAAGKAETIILGGGCFWGVEAVYEHVKGVIRATSGYAGGKADTAFYGYVSEGNSGHAEVVQITFDPAQVNLNQLLDVYFKVAHDPTELNRQGPDIGTQYRSEVFVTSSDQEKIVKEKIAQLNAAKIYSQPIVTVVGALQTFYPAEDYHQNYLPSHLSNPYIVMHDLPKLAKLRVNYPELYKD